MKGIASRYSARLVVSFLTLSLVTSGANGAFAVSAQSAQPGQGTGTAQLSVASTPADASVYLDGQLVGVTPVTLQRLDAGDHRLRVVKDGYLENGQVVTLSNGQRGSLEIRLTATSGAAQTPAPQAASAQAPAPGAGQGLRIVVVEGEDGVNIIEKKTAVAPIVEVRDRNNLPVAQVAVTFLIGGKGAAFSNGARTLTLTTDSAGRAVVTQLNPLSKGALQIQVRATYQGQTATATIHQTNFATAAQAQAAQTGAGSNGANAATSAGTAGGHGLSTLAIVGIAAGGVAGTVGVLKAIQKTPCVFSVSPTSLSAGGAASTFSVSVSASPADCDPAAWTATSSSPFITSRPEADRERNRLRCRGGQHRRRAHWFGDHRRDRSLSEPGAALLVQRQPHVADGGGRGTVARGHPHGVAERLQPVDVVGEQQRVVYHGESDQRFGSGNCVA